MSDTDIPINNSFMYGKTLMNGPVRDLGTIIVVLDKRSGTKIALDRKEDFNAKYHEYLPGSSASTVTATTPVHAPEDVIGSVVSAADTSSKSDEDRIREESDMVVSMQNRLEELKDMGRVNSPKNPFMGLPVGLKKEYSQLNKALKA